MRILSTLFDQGSRPFVFFELLGAILRWAAQFTHRFLFSSITKDQAAQLESQPALHDVGLLRLNKEGQP